MGHKYRSVFLLTEQTFRTFSDWPHLKDALESVSGAMNNVIKHTFASEES